MKVKKIKIKPPKKISVRANSFNGYSDPVLRGANAPVLGEQIVSVVDLNISGNPSSPLLQDIPNPNQDLPQAQFPVLSDFSNNPYVMPNPATFTNSSGGTSGPANPGSDIPQDATATTATTTTIQAVNAKWIPWVVGIIVLVAIIYFIKKIK